MGDYCAIADEITTDIRAGRLRPGERLLPQREFAYRRGIANSTASRVYSELAQRGLVCGEIGRGTFVRSMPPPIRPALSEPSEMLVDLELNFPTVPEQAALIAQAIGGVVKRADELSVSLTSVAAGGTEAYRRIAAHFLARQQWMPDPANVLFAGNGKQAIAAVLTSLVPPGERLGVEALTYPLIRSLASRLGIVLVPLAQDEHGIDPGDLERVQKSTPLKAVYLQPSLQNPLGITMSEARRLEIATVLKRHGLIAIEDAIYSFLDEYAPPIAVFAPENAVVIDSMSKRLSPGLTIGFIVAPPSLKERITTSLRTGAWTAAGFPMSVLCRLMTDGSAVEVARLKRKDAKQRQQMAASALAGLDLRADPRAYHCWLILPDHWRAEAFVAAAAYRGIAITPALAFAVGNGHAPNARFANSGQ